MNSDSRGFDTEYYTQVEEGVTKETNNDTDNAGTGSISGDAIDANQFEFRVDELRQVNSTIDVVVQAEGGYLLKAEEVRKADNRDNVVVIGAYESAGANAEMATVAGGTDITFDIRAHGE